MIAHVLALMLSLGAPVPSASGDTAPVAQADNADMQRLFDEDQAARKAMDPNKARDHAAIRALLEADTARRAATRHLLETGALRTGPDFYGAAFVFQHGGEAQDYLLAHTLALAAVARGQEKASWIAAATLDRYLTKIGQPQVYGTQFHRDGQEPWTQEPYQRELVPDALRAALGVPPRAEQDKKLAAFNTAQPR